MGFGIALSLLFVIGGAILRYGVTVAAHGLNLGAVGMILIVVGGVGFVLSVMWMAGQWPFRKRTFVHEREVLEPDPITGETIVHEHGPVRQRHEYFRHQRSA